MSMRLAPAAVVFCCCGLFASAQTMWLDVPFVRQEKNGCGAASIAMVMQYWERQQGEPISKSANAAHIQNLLFSKKTHGIYASDMDGYFEQHGFRAFAFEGNWDEVQKHLKRGRPLIVALKIASDRYPMHYVVIAGLGNDETILVNDPAQRKLLKEDRSTFDREWSAAGRWTLLAVPQTGH